MGDNQKTNKSAEVRESSEYMYIEDRLKALEDQIANLQDTVKELSGKQDKSVERWTWERYQRTEKKILPLIDGAVEKWTWERYNRICNDFSAVLDRLDKIEMAQGGPSSHWFDVIVPIGKACRTAKHLSDNRLRKSAYPLDWMMEYGIGTVLHLFKTGFEDFFADCEEDAEETRKLHENPSHIDKRYVIDTNNHITSIHHFFIKDTIDEGQQKFRVKMRKRADVLLNKLKVAEKVLFIGNRDESDEELKKFLTDIYTNCFPNADITLLNIRHDESMQIDAPMKLFREDEGKIHFCEYVFNDTNKSGGADYWLGDTDKWNEILKNIRLTDKFDSENQKSLRAFMDD